MKYLLGDLLDRYSIEYRKNMYGAKNDEILKEIKKSLSGSIGSTAEQLVIASIELGLANSDIANLEWQIREGEKLSLEEIGRRAVQIRKINDFRIKARNNITNLESKNIKEIRFFGYDKLTAKDISLGLQKMKE